LGHFEPVAIDAKGMCKWKPTGSTQILLERSPWLLKLLIILATLDTIQECTSKSARVVLP